ncbi:MAG: biopolymer transporter ExbD [Bacteroidota bacterium]|nr:biopolymer transporter ExbD [Bacteroidota bacterium]MDP4230160.1 biopolymer transporter ExbD [Bacteroidota bacterium]MDP4236276.1 biopolymer transporter ExbD [Bacteroidota bacterium]
MAEMVEAGGHGKKGKKSKKRVGVRMDMTPMVDVAFLLLTFFMLSTTLSTPQVMEISLPPDSKVKIEVGESNLLTIRVRKDDAVFWNKGKDAPQKITAAEISKILEQRLRENPKIATLIKIDREAKYQKLVDLIDELNLIQAKLGQTEKRFSIITMDKDDDALIGNL